MDPAELAGGFAMPAVMPMSSQIEESFRRRVKELPTPTQRFLIVAAAEPTGDPGTVWQAAKRLGIRPDEAAPAIDAGLIEIGMRVRFWHPLVRSAVYGGARVVDRQAAHRALAEATDPDEEPDRRAWHRALGSAAPDDDVADALERSADGARARGGLAAAAVLLERSFELTVDVPRRAERALSAVAAHIESASFDRAHALLANAEALPLDEMSHARVEMLRSRLSMFDGHARTAAGLMLRAAQHLEPLDAGLAVRAHLLALGAAYVAGTLGEGVSITDIALAASRCPMPLDLTIEGRLLTGLAQLTIDGPAAAAAALREALEMLPPETNSPETIQLMALQRGVAAVLWDIDAYQNCATSHVATMRAWRALTMLPVTLNALAHVRILTGDLDGARAAVTEANQLYAASGSKSWASAEPSLAALRGMDGAASSIDGQIQAARAADSGSQLKLALWASATLHNGLGQYDKALAVASEAMEHPWVWSGHLSFHELIEAAARCGQRDAAAAAFERLVETAAPCGSEWAMGIVCRSRALLAVGAAAEDLFREAIDLLTRTTLRPELARAHLLYGEWLRREGRRVDARAHLRSAYEMFAGMGIRAFGERARLELVTVGEMVRAPTADSFDTLTPQEAQIALLAADLHTNVEIGAQLFLSPRTVEWHLRKVFPKLKVSSRRELRVALSRERHLTAAP
jgi:DNA-binding CsgD family transcriptional regulator/tetratricopeptide (TPR) repeat protein